MRTGFPIATPGQAVGLLGGSFDPAHEGHVAITRAALARFGLDRVWWLVSPGNPLKPRGPAPLADRIARAEALMRHPRVIVTGLEAALGTRYTADTLARLTALYPGVRFVWLMGSDNLASFHRWENWRGIAARVPIGVLARPGSRLPARFAPAARALAPYRLPDAQCSSLGRQDAPALCLIDLPLNPASSSAIRARGLWSR
ncbi:MAG: nicotinate-nucleotide adenylyltransferase [Gemmobacter sp.]|uniref:nicotinate-nucleotide adenylyltransferase n=1 Tax=Gemmobacter sp. TaxID=1898957 RepID=UPI003919C0E9